MSASSRPSDRVRRCSAGATTDPAKPTPESEPIPPPIIAVDELEGEPVPGEGEEPPAIDVPWRLQQPARGRRLTRKPDEPRTPLTAEQRLLLLDTWRRSGLPAGDFAALVGGISKHTLYSWKKKFEREGPAGLADFGFFGSTVGSNIRAVIAPAFYWRCLVRKALHRWATVRRSALTRGVRPAVEIVGDCLVQFEGFLPAVVLDADELAVDAACPLAEEPDLAKDLLHPGAGCMRGQRVFGIGFARAVYRFTTTGLAGRMIGRGVTSLPKVRWRRLRWVPSAGGNFYYPLSVTVVKRKAWAR